MDSTEIKLIYNPIDKEFYIYNTEHFITNTKSTESALETFLWQVNRANKEFDTIREEYNKVKDVYLNIANNKFTELKED